MTAAATVPARSEISAFQSSEGRRDSHSSRYPHGEPESGTTSLLRCVQGHGAAGARKRDAALGDLAEDRLALAAEMGVVEPLTASDERAPDRRRRLPPGLVELDREDDRGPVLVGEQARGTLSEGARVERAADVGRVDGDAAPPRLRLDGSSPVDEVGRRRRSRSGRGTRRAVRSSSIAWSRSMLPGGSTVKKASSRRSARPSAADPPPGRRPRGLLDLLREVGVDVELLADAGEIGDERARRRLRQPDTTVRRHVLSRGARPRRFKPMVPRQFLMPAPVVAPSSRCLLAPTGAWPRGRPR